MISIIDVRPKADISWDDFYGNLSTLLERVEDRDNSVVICRELPDEWQPYFEGLGLSAEREVAWVRFDHTDGHFHFAFIAWNQKTLLDCVNHVGNEIMGGEMTAFVEIRPTIH